MRISKEQLNKLVSTASYPADERAKADSAVIRLMDAGVVRSAVQEILEMPDREELVARLKARIEAGEYDPSGDDIAEAMLRRAVVDSLVFED